MSTKCTIAYGDTFHFYHEVFDDTHVYLELSTTQFEAGYGRVMIPIPIHIWETIRPLGGACFDLLEKTDDELLADVGCDVDRRIEKFEEMKRHDAERARFLSLGGSLVYGPASTPREEQIKRGFKYFQNKRGHQREVHAAVQALRARQRAASAPSS